MSFALFHGENLGFESWCFGPVQVRRRAGMHGADDVLGGKDGDGIHSHGGAVK